MRAPVLLIPIAGPHARPFKIDGSRTCIGCGAELDQSANARGGRPRKWCSNGCARSAYRKDGRRK